MAALILPRSLTSASVLRDLKHDLVEEPAYLTCLAHVDHEWRENLRVLAKRRGQRVACLDVVADLAQDPSQFFVLRLLDQDAQGAQQRESAVNHSRKLPREDSQLLELHLLAEARDAELLAHPRFRLGDAYRGIAHRLELAGHLRLRVRVELARSQFAVAVADLVLIRRCRSCHVSVPYARPDNRWNSSMW